MLPLDSLKTLYYALIFPHLSYGVIAWGSADKGLIRQTELLKNVLYAPYIMHFTTATLTQNLESQNSSNYMISLNINHFYLLMII